MAIFFTSANRLIALVCLGLLLLFAVTAPAFAQPEQTTLERGDLVGPVPARTPPAVLENVPQEELADVADPDAVADAEGSYVPREPVDGIGMPVNGGIDIQPQFSAIGEQAYGLHIGLVWVMFAISAFVLALMVYAIVRFRKNANPVPSKTTHNTVIEVVWTVVPVLILVAIAIPSIGLLAAQYENPPEDAVTIKATGYQWYWGYTYPDNGEFEIISNMLDEEEALSRGEPNQLAVDNRMVVPAGVPIRLQVTAADVIHSFAVPSLWFKLDGVPGRLNERMFMVDEPGVYYGQCSELCGARHGFMPIAVEALPMNEWRAWVRAQGGTFEGDPPQGAEPLPDNAETAPIQRPESALPGAPGAGAPPTADTGPTT